MIQRIVKYTVVIGVLMNCTNIGFARGENPSQSIAFNATISKSNIELTCKPLNEAVAKEAVWVSECNQAAFEFLTSQVDKGVEFKRQIPEKPFGMAADFMANMLKSDPANFEAVSINQSYALISNKT